jgi:hypothetical protein
MVDILLAFALGVLTANVLIPRHPIIFLSLSIKEQSDATQTTNDDKAAAGCSQEPAESASQMETDVTSPARCSDASSPKTASLEWTEDFFRLQDEATDLLGPLGHQSPVSPLSGSDL